MSTLTGTQIKDTYPGLLKSSDNAVLGAVEKEITDGEGTVSTLKLGTTSASFVGTLDLSGATVTGLPGGAPGLVAGTGANTMQSAASLTTTPANAASPNTIALGDNSSSLFDGSIAIGGSSKANNYFGIALGVNARASQNYSFALGNNAEANGEYAMSIGYNSNAFGQYNYAFGPSNRVNGGIQNIILGGYANTIPDGDANVMINNASTSFPSGQNDNVGIGRNDGFGAGTSNSVCIGLVAGVGANAGDSTAIGRGATIGAGATSSTAIGYQSSTTSTLATAVGANVVGGKESFVSVNELEVTIVGGGVIMYSPDGTEYKLTIANGGTVLVTAV